jgi:hypothetical protein
VESVPTAIRLPREMHDRLRQSELGVSEEIRRRVERTFAEDALDPVTRELLAGITDLAAGVRTDLGAPWHAYGEVLNVFAAAVAQHLSDYKPLSPGEFGDLFRDMGFGQPAAIQLKEAPDVLGATIARTNQRMHSYEHLRRLQTERAAGKRKIAEGARGHLSRMRKKGKDNE